MASSRSTNTQQEALQRILGDIADIKTYPDADIEWLLGLETSILQKLRAPVQQAISQSDMGQMGQMGQPGGGQPAPQMAPQMAPTGAGAGAPGLRTSPSMPNPDELRRLLQAG